MPTPPGYKGWERSSVAAWEAVEAQGGIVPDIEEDRAHFPPAWLRYPSPLRSADLLADEARKPKGLYTKVEANDIQPGDVVVRVKGAGACGKMAVVAGRSDDQWVVLDTEGEKNQPPSGPPAMGEALPGQASAAVFFDGAKPRPETSIYRLAVKKDSSLGHVRELTRDLEHLERTIGERPPLITPGRRGAVDDLVHKLIDEAWSLMLDKPFEEDGRALTGRALALAAALDWPGAAEQAAAVLDDVLKRRSTRADAAVARASVHAARRRAGQGGLAGGGGDGEPGRVAAGALHRRARPAGRGQEGRGARRAQALRRGRRVRSARHPAAGDRGTRAGDRARAQAAPPATCASRRRRSAAACRARSTVSASSGR